jgi:two-component system OmpR family response regulator
MSTDTSPAPHILVVDDHREIRDALTRYLQRNGMRADAAEDARAMDKALAAGSYDLVILDVMMPGEDGLSVCRRLAVETDIPILMLTALGEDTDRIVGLELGADDYLAKPFNPREVLARIKAILRRSERVERAGGDLGGQTLRFDRWLLDVDRRRLSDEAGAETPLTTAEFRLLTVFLERPRLVLSRDRLLDLTAGREGGPFDRAIDNQVSRLRRKIERDPASPEIITTVRGGGYCLSTDVTRRT